MLKPGREASRNKQICKEQIYAHLVWRSRGNTSGEKRFILKNTKKEEACWLRLSPDYHQNKLKIW